MNPKTINLRVFSQNKINLWITAAGIFLVYMFMNGCQRGTEQSEISATPVASNYAADRALIEDLQARYMFALDFGDIDKYVATFTEDGILDIGEGEWVGRDTIRKVLAAMPEAQEPPADPDGPQLHPSTGRHNISNIVIKIEGDTAYGRAYWFHMSNNNLQRSATLDSYGHYEDVMVKVNGSWLFSKRKIYNEQVSKWAASKDNPSW
ncbi:MAG: nuclear transport factor 2 family protein [Bacteroidales bacterium]|nr:nuclear transport factor 2 family protein [Bacteroidales bacterium]